MTIDRVNEINEINEAEKTKKLRVHCRPVFNKATFGRSKPCAQCGGVALTEYIALSPFANAYSIELGDWTPICTACSGKQKEG